MTHLIERFTEHLKKGKYNSQTVAAYRNAIFVYYNHFRDEPQNKMTDAVISEYLMELSEKKGNSVETVKQAGKAIKLFYEIIFSRKLNIKASGEMKVNNLPQILNQAEVKKVLESLENQKHKTLLSIIYAAGLRLSEVLNLKLEDIDFEEKCLVIQPSGNEKARTLMLSEKLIPILQNYIKRYQPTDLLFAGERGNPYSSRSVQLVLQGAVKNSGIEKDATVHTLRHSFAVHLLEKGLDLHYLQDILGHRYLQTTAIYNQLVKVEIPKLKSPFDEI